MDNENHSDFDPQNAIHWSLQIFPKKTEHLLGQHVSKFLHMCQSSTIIPDLIGDLLKRKHFNGKLKYSNFIRLVVFFSE